MAYIDELNAISAEIGISAGEFRELPRKVRRWALAAWRGLQERELQQTRGADTMLKAVEPEQCDEIDAKIKRELDEAIRHYSGAGSAVGLGEIARLTLARATFRALRDGSIPVAYANRAVYGVLANYSGGNIGEAATSGADSYRFE